MLCYRGMTFCDYYVGCAKGTNCPRALTKRVQEQAEQWWSEFGAGEVPISYYPEIPKCFITTKDLESLKQEFQKEFKKLLQYSDKFAIRRVLEVKRPELMEEFIDFKTKGE